MPRSVCGSLLPTHLASEICRVVANGNHLSAPSLPQDLPDTGLPALGDGMQPPPRAPGMPTVSRRK